MTINKTIYRLCISYIVLLLLSKSIVGKELKIDAGMDKIYEMILPIEPPEKGILWIAYRTIPAFEREICIQLNENQDRTYSLNCITAWGMSINAQTLRLKEKFPSIAVNDLKERVKLKRCSLKSSDTPTLAKLIEQIRFLSFPIVIREGLPVDATKLEFNIQSDVSNYKIDISDYLTIKDNQIFKFLIEIKNLCPCIEQENENKMEISKDTPDPLLIQHAKKNDIVQLRNELNKGISVNISDSIGNTVLFYAIRNKDINMVRYLIEQGSELNIRNCYGRSPLLEAVWSESIEAVKILLENGAFVGNCDILGRDALIAAAQSENDNANIVKLLIQYGASCTTKDKSGLTALAHAILNENNECFRILLKECGDKSKDSISLICAAHYNRLSYIELMINNNFDINCTDQNGNNALMEAIEFDGDIKTCKYLIQKHISLDCQDELGETALMKAIRENKYDIAILLIESGTNVNIVDQDGWSAIAYASRFGNNEVISLLLNKGAFINISDALGYSPLMLATLNRNKSIIEILLSNGADPSMKVQKGINKNYDCLRFATENEDNDIVKMLLSKLKSDESDKK